MDKIDLSKNSLKKFGITMGIAFFIIAALLYFRHKQAVQLIASISILFFIGSFLRPLMLKPVYIFWMKLAFILGWVNTRLILLAVFYLVLTPIGILMKIFKADLLDLKIDKTKDSYWKRVEKSTDYQRQF